MPRLSAKTRATMTLNHRIDEIDKLIGCSDVCEWLLIGRLDNDGHRLWRSSVDGRYALTPTAEYGPSGEVITPDTAEGPINYLDTEGLISCYWKDSCWHIPVRRDGFIRALEASVVEAAILVELFDFEVSIDNVRLVKKPAA